jgi:hypothetical protein
MIYVNTFAAFVKTSPYIYLISSCEVQASGEWDFFLVTEISTKEFKFKSRPTNHNL